MRSELTEEEKDLIVLNNFSSNPPTSNTQLLIDSDTEVIETIDRVTLTGEISRLHVVVCDMSDLYEDMHYVNTHKLKVLQDVDIKVSMWMSYSWDIELRMNSLTGLCYMNEWMNDF